ncbi:MAG: nuclear transport factor 2 family protein [Myxococcota bacterium]
MTTTNFDLDGFLSAFGTKDVDAVLDFLTDDVVVIDAGSGEELEGREQVRQLLREMKEAVRTVVIEPELVLHGHAALAVLARVHLVRGRDMAIPEGSSVPVGGRTVDLTGAFFATLDEQGHITRLTRVADRRMALRELGLSRGQKAGASVELLEFIRPDVHGPGPTATYP